MIKKVLRALLPNPFDRLLDKARKEGKTRFLLIWNRGLGDIALGLYAMVHRIREKIPEASIAFITRKDLEEGFSMLPSVKTHVSPLLKRGIDPDLPSILASYQEPYDVLIERPDPTYWVKWQIGSLQPKLRWNPSWNTPPLLDPAKKYIAVHVDSETSYGYQKNWPQKHWETLFTHLAKKQIPCFLLGKAASVSYPFPNIIDLRGKTTLTEALSLIKNSASHFIGPDSGILSLLYYIDEAFPLKAISLWADPKQGILKQSVLSPNPYLEHVPLIAENKNLEMLLPREVIKILC